MKCCKAARLLLTMMWSYTMTVHAALAVVERVLTEDAPQGFQTPSTAYGCDFVLGLEGMVTTTPPGEAVSAGLRASRAPNNGRAFLVVRL